MQALINDNELVEALAIRMIKQRMKSMRPSFEQTARYITKCYKRNSSLDFDIIKKTIYDDLWTWRDEINIRYKKYYRPLINWLQSKVDQSPITRDGLLALTLKDRHLTITQSVANTLDNAPELITKDTKIDQDVLIRNILGNEKLLSQLMRSNKKFWFLDSGYTNFLTGRKTWHRLVRNHIHQSCSDRYFPADRLHLLPTFPARWKHTGRDILVVESSDQHYQLDGTTKDAWRSNIRHEISQHTARTVVFKEKTVSRKDRLTVYEMLKQQPDRWYCVVSDSSAAALEAIWLGIPVITLKTHITNPVSRNSISHINDLYRGPIGDWLCALTYSQFTVEELTDGTARRILGEYYHA